MAAHPSLDELRAVIDERLASFLATRREAIPEASPMIDEIERLVRAGGKRLRPAFCYWGYRAAGGPPGLAIEAASASLELLHTFAIVHDDIMDSSQERRGQPTVHARQGTSVALLVGDLALVLADALFVDCGLSPKAILRSFDAYSRMRQEVIAGQFLDLVNASSATVSEEKARRVAVLKSGRYSVQEPLAIGALLAGARRELVDALAAFGAPLGEAFQLRDDLLGMFGEAETLGKPIDSDIREGKRHVLFAKAAESLTGSEREFFLAHWGGGAALSHETVDTLRELVERCGARAETESLLVELVALAANELDKAPIDPGARAALVDLAREATDRAV